MIRTQDLLARGHWIAGSLNGGNRDEQNNKASVDLVGADLFICADSDPGILQLYGFDYDRIGSGIFPSKL